MCSPSIRRMENRRSAAMRKGAGSAGGRRIALSTAERIRSLCSLLRLTVRKPDINTLISSMATAFGSLHSTSDGTSRQAVNGLRSGR